MASLVLIKQGTSRISYNIHLQRKKLWPREVCPRTQSELDLMLGIQIQACWESICGATLFYHFLGGQWWQVMQVTSSDARLCGWKWQLSSTWFPSGAAAHGNNFNYINPWCPHQPQLLIGKAQHFDTSSLYCQPQINYTTTVSRKQINLTKEEKRLRWRRLGSDRSRFQNVFYLLLL